MPTSPAATSRSTRWRGARRGGGDGGHALVDPFGGLADLGARRLRAVGDADARFREDALRMVRAIRLAAALGFEVEAGTLAAIRANAGLVAHLSGERVGAELTRLLAAPAPSVGLRLAMRPASSPSSSPDLAAQRGIPQNKAPGEDLWDHTLRTVDAAPADRPVVRLAALLHDIGKPATLADGRFHHHDAVGARLAEIAAAPAALPAGDDRRGRPTSSATTCSRSTRRRRTPRSAGSSGGSDARPPRRAVRAPAGGRHRQRHDARRSGGGRVPGARRGGARGPPAARPQRTGGRRRRPDVGARARSRPQAGRRARGARRPGRRPTPRSTTGPRSCSSRRACLPTCVPDE